MYHFTITSQWFCCIDPNSPSRDTILYILGSHSNEISNYPAIFVYFTHLLPLLAPSSGYLLSISLISCLLLPGVQESFFPECLGSQPPLNLLPPLWFFFSFPASLFPLQHGVKVFLGHTSSWLQQEDAKSNSSRRHRGGMLKGHLSLLSALSLSKLCHIC